MFQCVDVLDTIDIYASNYWANEILFIVCKRSYIRIYIFYLPKSLNILGVKQGAGCRILWLGELKRSSSSFVNLNCAQVDLVYVPKIGFYFVGLSLFPSGSWLLSFLSLLLVFSFPSNLAWFMRECLKRSEYCFCESMHFLAFVECSDEIGSLHATWSYVLVKSYSCYLRAFYMTLV